MVLSEDRLFAMNEQWPFTINDTFIQTENDFYPFVLIKKKITQRASTQRHIRFNLCATSPPTDRMLEFKINYSGNNCFDLIVFIYHFHVQD